MDKMPIKVRIEAATCPTNGIVHESHVTLDFDLDLDLGAVSLSLQSKEKWGRSTAGEALHRKVKVKCQTE